MIDKKNKFVMGMDNHSCLWETDENAQALSSLFSTLAHDLKSPLNALSLGIDVIGQSPDSVDSNDFEEIVEEIKRGNSEIMWIISNIDALSLLLIKNKDKKEESITIDLESTIKMALLRFEAINGKDIIEFNVDSAIKGLGNPIFVDTVVNNMLKLLLRYSQPSNHIKIELSSDKQEYAVITASAMCPVFNGMQATETRLDRGLALTVNALAAARDEGRFTVSTMKDGELVFKYCLPYDSG